MKIAEQSLNRQRQRGFSLGNLLFLVAIVGGFYAVFGSSDSTHSTSSSGLVGKHSTQIIQELGQPKAKEKIPRPS